MDRATGFTPRVRGDAGVPATSRGQKEKLKLGSLSVQNAYLTEMLKQAGLDAEARDVAERIQSVLTDEIHHRMKNMLTMVTAIVRQSMRSATNLVDAEAAISTRLIAMAKAHDLLLKADLKSARLSAVIRGAIEQHNTAMGCIDIEGEDIEVVPSAILPVALILNELCTNATKYGALSLEQGRITLAWTRDASSGALVLRWTERNGPLVGCVGNKSFGSRLLEQGIPRQLGGFGRLSFPAAGVEYVLTIPLEKLLPLEVAS
jgi:two-component sensor histidine kinase